jgi:hypothetical protein
LKRKEERKLNKLKSMKRYTGEKNKNPLRVKKKSRGSKINLEATTWTNLSNSQQKSSR